MTIKRRLFISNILMLFLPIVLTFSIVALAAVAYIGIFNMDFYHAWRNSDQFEEAISDIQHLSNQRNNSSYDTLKTDVESIYDKYSSNSLSLSIYEDKQVLQSFGEFEDNSIVPIALSEPNNNYFTMNNTSIYSNSIDSYTILVMDTNYTESNVLDTGNGQPEFPDVEILLYVMLIIIILITNRLLTQMIVKKIITPLDMLVYGVHQIRDGNLDYHIQYVGKDEFATVCSDFNEMAARLKSMVNARQKDEQNRKELIAGISHDLRTPLTSIKTYVEGIELGVASTPAMQHHYFATIKNKANDLEQIVNQLFLFSKLDIGEFPLKLEPLDLGLFLNDFVKGITEEYYKKGLIISLNENIQDISVNVDIAQFKNVLINIFENSQKYKNQETATIDVTCHSSRTHVSLSLTDNGPGVPEDSIENLFSIFYRVDKSRNNTTHGSGLGLAIAAKTIERFGGTIGAWNMPECGLQITIELPLQER